MEADTAAGPVVIVDSLPSRGRPPPGCERRRLRHQTCHARRSRSRSARRAAGRRRHGRAASPERRRVRRGRSRGRRRRLRRRSSAGTSRSTSRTSGRAYPTGGRAWLGSIAPGAARPQERAAVDVGALRARPQLQSNWSWTRPRAMELFGPVSPMPGSAAPSGLGRSPSPPPRLRPPRRRGTTSSGPGARLLRRAVRGVSGARLSGGSALDIAAEESAAALLCGRVGLRRLRDGSAFVGDF